MISYTFGVQCFLWFQSKIGVLRDLDSGLCIHCGLFKNDEDDNYSI